MNIRQLILDGCTRLERSGVPNARRNAEWLLASVLGCGLLDLFVGSYQVPSAEGVKRYEDFLQRRMKREPLQYITEDTAFMSLPFKVRHGVFVPRPDTEVLVEIVQKKLKKITEAIHILDLCCGAGVIGVSLAARMRNSEVTGVDSSKDAVLLAKENAMLNGVSDRVRIEQMTARHFFCGEADVFNAVVCNPPYIPTEEISKLPPEIRDHEPRYALDGGADGLDFVREIIPMLPEWIQPGGFGAFEIAPPQKSTVVALFEAVGFVEIEVYQDYGQRDRVVIGHRSL